MRTMADVMGADHLPLHRDSAAFPPIFNAAIVMAGRWMVLDNMALIMYCLIQRQMLYYIIIICVINARLA